VEAVRDGVVDVIIAVLLAIYTLSVGFKLNV